MRIGDLHLVYGQLSANPTRVEPCDVANPEKRANSLPFTLEPLKGLFPIFVPRSGIYHILNGLIENSIPESFTGFIHFL